MRIKCRIFPIAVIVLTLFGFENLASAEPLRTFKVGGWSGGAYSIKGTKRFSHCAASASYRSGVLMLFSVNREYQWNIGFASNTFDLVPGKSVRLGLSIDGDRPSIVTGYAVSRTFANITLAPTAELFNRFRRGETVKLIAKDVSHTFNLTDTSRILPALVNCVNNALRPAPMQVAKDTRSGSTDGATTPSINADHRAEATAMVANLLSHAGVKDFRIVPASEDEIGKTADALWIAQNIAGALFIIVDQSLKKPSDTSPQIIALAARACKGTFFSGALPDEGVGKQARVFTTCQTGNTAKTNYYIIMARRSGGHYVFMTETTGDEGPAKDADASIRSAALKIVGQ